MEASTNKSSHKLEAQVEAPNSSAIAIAYPIDQIGANELVKLKLLYRAHCLPKVIESLSNQANARVKNTKALTAASYLFRQKTKNSVLNRKQISAEMKDRLNRVLK